MYLCQNLSLTLDWSVLAQTFQAMHVGETHCVTGDVCARRDSHLCLCIWLYISERSVRQAAIHHVLLLLRPGGLWADPLLLQREAAPVLQCWHRPCESHILPQCPWGLCCVCVCVYMLCRKSSNTVNNTWCFFPHSHIQTEHSHGDSLFLFNLSDLFFCIFVVSFPESMPRSHRRLSFHHHILVVHEVGSHFTAPAAHTLCCVHDDRD